MGHDGDEGEFDGNSYDSELEADFFGTADKDRTAEDEKYYDMINARK